MKKFLIAILLAGSCAIVPSVLAHQTYTVSGDGAVFVSNPGKGALYNRTLAGAPQAFEFDAQTPFTLRVRLLVPEAEGQERDVSAVILNRTDAGSGPVAELEPGGGSWNERLIDPKTRLPYLVGARVARELPAGKYAIRVTSPGNDSAYALLFGTMDDEEPLPVMQGAGDLSTRNTIILGGILVAFALGILFHVRKHDETAVAEEALPKKKVAVRKAPRKDVV